MAQQLAFKGFDDLGTKRFGGLQLKGNPRIARPISLKKPVHLVLKSELARGSRSFLRKPFEARIEASVRRLSKLTNIRVFRFVNAGDHLQLILHIRSRKAFHKFVRALSGHIARIVLDAERGRAQEKKFWIARPFTRILNWKKDFIQCKNHIAKNLIFALGFIQTVPQKNSSA
jgi:REP element-mobilizing transposase RayT